MFQTVNAFLFLQSLKQLHASFMFDQNHKIKNNNNQMVIAAIYWKKVFRWRVWNVVIRVSVLLSFFPRKSFLLIMNFYEQWKLLWLLLVGIMSKNYSENRSTFACLCSMKHCCSSKKCEKIHRRYSSLSVVIANLNTNADKLVSSLGTESKSITICLFFDIFNKRYTTISPFRSIVKLDGYLLHELSMMNW